MKKTLSLLLVAVALFSLFALPSFASEGETVVMRNLEARTRVLRADVKMGSWTAQWEVTLENGTRTSGDNIAVTSTMEQTDAGMRLVYQFQFKEGDTVKAYREVYCIGAQTYMDTVLPTNPNKTPTSATIYQVQAGNMKSSVLAFFSEPTCDGSSCSWADANLDGVCDTCAKTLRMYPYQSIEEYAHVHLNTAVNNLYPDDEYWLFYTMEEGADVDVYILSSPVPFVYDVAKGVQASTSASFHKSSVTLMSVTDGVPQYGGTGWSTTDNTKFDGTVIDPYKVVDSSHNIEGFFPIPLHQVIQGVTEGTMTTQIPKIGGTISVLIISGIGLLALLIAFVLLVKALRKFLP